MLAPSSDRILVELFQILKDDAVESAALNMQYAICTQYAICRLPAMTPHNPLPDFGSFLKQPELARTSCYEDLSRVFL